MPVTSGPTPNHSQIMAGLRSFLLDVLPENVEVVQGQANLVPEPTAPDFVLMTEIRRERLETNIDLTSDVKTTGAISAGVATIASVAWGTISVGDPVFGVGVQDGTVVESMGTGAGGAGTYNVQPIQDVAGPLVLSFGNKTACMHAKVTVQLDVHGPASCDNAQKIATLMRDEYATDFFAHGSVDQGVDLMALHADDPVQIPFVNDQNQFEDRWIVTAFLQANVTVVVPQEYADSVNIGLIEADLLPP